MNKTTVRLILCAGTVVVVAALSPRLAHGQPPLSSGPGGASDSAAGLNGLRPEQMGPVAGSSLDGTGTTIVPFQFDAMKGVSELPVAGVAAAALAPRPPGTVDQQVLAGEIAARLEPLEDCRTLVARRKQVVASDVAADHLTLRWIIAETGRAFGAEVVAATPTDDAVLDCVKRQMSDWTFSPPSGGPLPIERGFTFRASPPAR